MIWLILLLAILVRLISINQSLWLDEAISAQAVQNLNLTALVTDYTRSDFHPPGYVVIVWLWTRLFGFSEIALRAPSVVFGVLTIGLIYLIGKKIHSEKLGLVAAWLLAINPLHLYYSQEARMYSLAALAVALNFYFFLKLVAKEGSVFWGYFLSLLLVVSSDYLAYLVIPAQLVILLLNKSAVRVWLGAVGLTVLAWVWWLPMLMAQLSVGQAGITNLPAWKEVVGGFGIKPLVLTYVKFIIGRISHPNDLVYRLLFLPVGGLFGYLLFKALVQIKKREIQLLSVWLIIPLTLATAISVLVPVYSYFRLLFVLPAFLLLISWGLVSLKNFKGLALAVVVELSASIIYLSQPQFHREDWRALVEFLENRPPQTVILFESSGTFAPFDYYSRGQVTGQGALSKMPAQNLEDLADLAAILKGRSEIYLAEYLVDITDQKRLVQTQLARLDFNEVEILNFNGVGLIRHYKKARGLL